MNRIIIQRPRIGAHLPIGKGLKHTVDEAVTKGLDGFQIFVRNPRGRGARKLTAAETDYFKATVKAHNIDPVVVHIPYICNPAAAKDDLYEFARQVVKEDLERCDLIGADYLVLHPGSYTTSSPEQGIARIAGLLNDTLDQYAGSVTVLLETMSGQGTELGKNFTELNQILELIRNRKHIGVCLDTCHVFAAGYDVRSEAGIAAIMEEVDNTCGRSSVKLVHSNDSQKELGSKRDRHAHIGEGFIGLAGFKRLISHEFFRTLPFILETPFGQIDKDIAVLKELR
ncbi:MAG: deoxyribonuclease IV [Heliobacteriaceae bacterium]|nr:deoxyribonuclease IV [Heliobacteriaceae bacterium]MDD4588603.1 deoxyribonuclease IV [Heliobacteriaceae bacterium]